MRCTFTSHLHSADSLLYHNSQSNLGNHTYRRTPAFELGGGLPFFPPIVFIWCNWGCPLFYKRTHSPHGCGCSKGERHSEAVPKTHFLPSFSWASSQPARSHSPRTSVLGTFCLQGKYFAYGFVFEMKNVKGIPIKVRNRTVLSESKTW